MTVRDDLIDYIAEHTRTAPGGAEGEPVISVHFFKVLIGESFDREHFREMALAAMAEPGEFNDIDSDRAANGPSYLEWGGWIGSQDLALRFMACGQAADMWDVITPATLHVEGAQADEMAGRGFVMTAGLRTPTTPEGAPS